jgi:hypothetical protein
MKFNIKELKRTVAERFNAKPFVSMIQFAKSGYNKVFRLVTGSDSVVIACISCSNDGAGFKTATFEVATIELVGYP